MSAQMRPPPASQPQLTKMTLAHLDAVVSVEQAAYEFPWTRGNFIDALAAGHDARVLHSDGQTLGYFVAMAGVEEMHLLNLTVAPAAQGRGHARWMLGEIVALCRQHAALQLWLEVRGSNTRARAIYQRFGFADIGRRKGYYPAPHGLREDALVMALPVTTPRGLDALE